ncbi:ABC transporter substrate-binding protein [Actinomadura kijaniata]|uniref:Osmoprotectant transport system substrate-binding protein n=1 Tax=Actinomadura namibiensis TaxID=182080 RepID=A0A7W3LJB0_ACTNM|nr:ABC transporter substrate-binding protein [Actinomadura namibiensis]MBA8949125.1 osmoprotectant transport system substrate-binding protein [Actinomadura namibiensis]
MIRKIRGAAVLLAGALALAACGGGDGGDPLKKGTEGGGGGGAALVIGTANFPESAALGEVYAQALAAKGVKAETKMAGTREAFYKAISGGQLAIVPEYNGNLLLHVDPKAAQTATDQVNTALKTKLPAELEILDSAKAEDKDAVVVTKATADKHKLKTIADLKPVAKDLVFGGPPEFKTRVSGLVGIKDKYGVEFKEFKALDVAGPITVARLKQDQVQAANLFTTDAAITRNGFVALEDPQSVFPAQNVTPLVYKSKVDAKAREVLNAVSAKLTTQDLLDMNTKMSVDKADPKQVAEEWLKKSGLA